MDLERVRQELVLLDFLSPRRPSDAEVEYFRFYGIDFEARMDAVQHYFGSLQAAGFDIACHLYRQPAAVATCYIVHGYFDHAGLYRHLIEYFLRQRRDVVLIDLPGHGLSSGPRASIEAFADYESVLDSCVRANAATNQQAVEFMGQSTGAAVIMQYLLDKKYEGVVAEPQHIVLLAPLVRPAKWPALRLAIPLQRLAFDSIKRRFSNNSHDQAFLSFLRDKDPLQFKSLPLQWVQAMRVWIGRFLASPASDLSPLLIQGEQDKTVDWRYNTKMIREKFPSLRMHFLADGKHHLVNESEAIRRKIFHELDAYLNADGDNAARREVPA